MNSVDFARWGGPRSFASEVEAKKYIEAFLAPYFVLRPEVGCRHLLAGNRLRIDYVGRPRADILFPFPSATEDSKDDCFGLEVKKSCAGGGDYNAAIKQAIDYTFCTIDDARPSLQRINGHRILRVYLYPARGDQNDLTGVHEGYWVNRLAGKFHVGMLYEICGLPAFFACADRQWCARYGARRGKHNTRQLVGSGAARMAL